MNTTHRSTLLLTCFFCFYFFNAIAQAGGGNNAGKLDDFSRININIFIPADSLLIDEKLTPGEYRYIHQSLTNKLRSYVARHGFSGTNRSPRFMLFPTLIVLERSYTATSPTLVIQELEVSLYLADYIDKKTFEVTTMKIKGVGRTKEQAFRKAFSELRYGPNIKQFLDEGKQSILTYYNDQCDFIKQEVEMLASTHRYKDAFNMLLQIPQASKDCYEMAMTMIPDYHKQMVARECHVSMAKARTAWAGKSKSIILDREQDAQVGIEQDVVSESFKKEDHVDTESGVSSSLVAKETRKLIYEALTYLDAILPDSECYGEATALLEEIKAYVSVRNEKLYEDEKKIAMMRLQLAADAADASMAKSLKDMTEQQRDALLDISKD